MSTDQELFDEAMSLLRRAQELLLAARARHEAAAGVPPTAQEFERCGYTKEGQPK
jgi:hypothetical protein